MTPAARFQAAAEILDQFLNGMPAEQCLTRWARNSRYAGSKDRAAIRDIVYDALRCKRSYAHLGGAETGRGLILGALRARGEDLARYFTGETHAPPPLTLLEADFTPQPMPELVALDCPDWLAADLKTSLGPDFRPILESLRQRAPVFLRVNAARISREQVITLLAQDGIGAQPHPLAPTALEVIDNPRAIQRSRPYLDGLVELQDAASQAVISELPDMQGQTVLDYCAGGGGKALALAALGAKVTAHDANPARMRDLPLRAARAQVDIALSEQPDGMFDLVVTDVPCSGSGSWRRSPAGKWALTRNALDQLHLVQAQILDSARSQMRPDGWLAYVTCSVLASENQQQIQAFLNRTPELQLAKDLQLTPLDGGDGFYLALMKARAT